jgi:sec-independent protein translocase protein TatA
VNLGAPELLIVLVVVLLLFGGAKLPQLARSLGQAQGEFRKAVQRPEVDGPGGPDAPVRPAGRPDAA